MARGTAVRQVLQSAAAATGNGSTLEFGGMEELAVQVDGTFVGTVSFEGSLDNANWYAVPLQSSSGAWVSSATAAGMFVTNLAAYPLLRARVSAYTSGSITATAFAEE